MFEKYTLRNVTPNCIIIYRTTTNHLGITCFLVTLHYYSGIHCHVNWSMSIFENQVLVKIFSLRHGNKQGS